MKYKYKRRQIIGKKLPVPQDIREAIFDNNLRLNDYFSYNLIDKIPLSCLNAEDRLLVERFGIDKAVSIDQDFLQYMSASTTNYRDYLLSLPVDTGDLNLALYEKACEELLPHQYTDNMKRTFPNRVALPSDNLPENVARSFNLSTLSLEELIDNWSYLKDKSLSHLFKKYTINEADFRGFIETFSTIMPLLRTINMNTNSFSFEQVLKEYYSLGDSDARKKFMGNFFFEKILVDKIEDLKNGHPNLSIPISNEQYRTIFKYTSLDRFVSSLIQSFEHKEYKMLHYALYYAQVDDVLPFDVLAIPDVAYFVTKVGVNSVALFDKENGGFFTKDNYKVLKRMYKDYVYRAGNVYSAEKYLFEHDWRNGDHFTRDEFYQSMRKIMLYGPTDPSVKVPINFRDIEGTFRDENPDLFLALDAPKELQDLYYSRSLSPKDLFEHPEYIDFLKDKQYRAGFAPINMIVRESHLSERILDLFDFIEQKMEPNAALNILKDFSNIFPIVFHSRRDTLVDFYVEPDWTWEIFEDELLQNYRKRILMRYFPFSEEVPSKFKKRYPNMFLTDDVPEDLKESFYNRKIDFKFFKNNREAIPYFLNVDMNLLMRYALINDKGSNSYRALPDILEKYFSKMDTFNLLLDYGPLLSSATVTDEFYKMSIDQDTSIDELYQMFDDTIYHAIIDYNILYDESAPVTFKSRYSELFLSTTVPASIKEKFYKKLLTAQDFLMAPNLLSILGNINIALGFTQEYGWLVKMFESYSLSQANAYRIKVLFIISKLNDVVVANTLKEFIIEHNESINIDNLDFLYDVLIRLTMSNSLEIYNFRRTIAEQLLNTSHPLERLKQIEEVFIKNNLPTVGKRYLLFNILNPHLENLLNEKTSSPVLIQKSDLSRRIIIFSDLFKASLGSNNRSIISYIANIAFGSKIFEAMKAGSFDLDSLSERTQQELNLFIKNLYALYKNSLRGAKEESTYTFSQDVKKDMFELALRISPNGSLNYNLGDRLINMFGHFAGFNTLSEVQDYIENKIKQADRRNRMRALRPAVIQKGDFIKGIKNIEFLANILQNGSISKEFLGESSCHDNTPLDTDLSLVDTAGSIANQISDSISKDYGPIWLVLRNDERISITKNGEVSVENVRYDASKLEAFETRQRTHYGIRTGFASSDIDYIIVKDYDPRIGLEIALNGFYIPVANFEGQIVFSPQEYDNIRDKMSGLSYFGNDEYKFSTRLSIDDEDLSTEAIKNNQISTEIKRNKIFTLIKEAVNELGLRLSFKSRDNLEEGIVELIDTGSTGRNTNTIGEGDFDFLMKLDRSIFINSERLDKLKKVLLRKFDKNATSDITANGDFRLKGIRLDDGTVVDIDITFTTKTDNNLYSTDEALKDRLSTIKRNNEEKYYQVIANILKAKKLLKEAGCYKSRVARPIAEGGLGGVGIENWILQNGGSLDDAIDEFIAYVESDIYNYRIWDFGENHLAERRGLYAHDEFISNNMDVSGIKKMYKALKTYKQEHNKDIHTDYQGYSM